MESTDREVILRAAKIYTEMDVKSPLVKVELISKEGFTWSYEIDVNRVERIYIDPFHFYIVYRAAESDIKRYRPFIVDSIPEGARAIEHRVKVHEIRDVINDGRGPEIKKTYVKRLHIPIDDSLDLTAEYLGTEHIKYYDYGCRRCIKIRGKRVEEGRARITIHNRSIYRYEVVEDPEIVLYIMDPYESDPDEDIVGDIHELKGTWLVLYSDYGVDMFRMRDSDRFRNFLEMIRGSEKILLTKKDREYGEKIVLRIKHIERISPPNSSRIGVILVAGDGSTMRYSIDASRIDEIYLDPFGLYIVYRTAAEHKEFYKPYTVDSIPKNATKAEHKIYEHVYGWCETHKNYIEREDDEPYCPYAMREARENFIETCRVADVKRVVLWIQFDRIEMLAKYIGSRYRVYQRKPYIDDIDIEGEEIEAGDAHVDLNGLSIRRYRLVRDPLVRERVEGRLITDKLDGTWLALDIGVSELEATVLIRESDSEGFRAILDTIRKAAGEMKRNREDWEARRRAAEELRETITRERLIEEIVRSIPGWADAAVIVERIYRGSEDADVDFEIYPAKRSKFGEGYYYSERWRPLTVKIENLTSGDMLYLLKKHNLINKLVTKNGKICDAEIEGREARYESQYRKILART